jgi:catechol 2,3-dioxygenase-like lactoylglutathione lyase family enzyme
VTSRVDHVGVVVRSLEEAGAFVQDILGLELTLAPPPSPDGVRVAYYGGDGARVELIEVADLVAREARLGRAQARLEHVAIEVDDVRSMADRLRVRGVRFTTEGPVPVRDTLAIWTVPETSGGIAWQLFSRGLSPGRP